LLRHLRGIGTTGRERGNPRQSHWTAIAQQCPRLAACDWHQLPQSALAIEELFGITFTPAALIGFEKILARLAEPVVQDIQQKLASTDGPVHADETYSTLNGSRAYYWVHANDSYVHFKFDTTRSGQVSREVLGQDFTGTLVTDCYSAYAAQLAGAKQKCLAHLARFGRAKLLLSLSEL
jgi:hypothetical protein